ncbi:neprilysin-2-like isoform X2 [Leptopilina boulardi]|nr:neprilysin-2-like isoform X2 [Leptopilina boulardi]XP_051158316.1 neprilysin-2-like isoform X2 [Leptopilina boulardi]XP_051158317.1 neprilysin-2-like isoform X2 [Leptopilina boulardi]XP_051158318.1 neprilysin-2-like isoform X2 [Leptopilina boulardi]XP_051158319.1 neprilysin-2-like isoform X2 [Leptopilina boulardi]
MLNNEQKNFMKNTRWRRALDLKLELTTFCFALLICLPEAHTLKKTSDNRKDYCLKPECLDTASRVLEYMDKGFDPCDNFYKFACGNFPKSRRISNYESDIIDSFSLLENKIDQEMKTILEKNDEPTEPNYARLIKAFYRECMNANKIEQQNLNLILDLLKKIGGWPLLEGNSWNNVNFQWEKFGFLLDSFKDNFISSHFVPDVKNHTTLILKIEPPTNLNLSPKYYNKINDTVHLFGAKNDNIKTDIDKIIEIEKMLINITVPTRDRNYNNCIGMTFKELNGNYSNILWREYIDSILNPVTNIRDDDIIFVVDLSYFHQLNNLINQISKKDQANYVIWKAINDLLSNYVGASEDNPQKWKHCYYTVDNFFPNSLGMLYVKYYFNLSESGKKDIDEMLENIVQQFNTLLNESYWLDDKIKEKALEKLASLSITHPVIYKLFDDMEIDEYYAKLNITPNNYLQLIIDIQKFNRNKAVDLFRKSLNTNSWYLLFNPMIVNTIFIYDDNSIALPPGIFQGVFFNENIPQYMNYGAIGFYIGHECTHGFDSFDSLRNLDNWWEPESRENFRSRIQCLINQYGNYTLNEVNLNINGTRTAKENTADNGGVKTAYLAYQSYVKKHGREALLPGVNYTQLQLFWISFAQTLCEKITLDVQREKINIYNHSPNEFRVLGSLVNREEFAKDFQCSNNKRMNPREKCSVW